MVKKFEALELTGEKCVLNFGPLKWMSQTDNYRTLLWMQAAEFHFSCTYNLGVLVGKFANCTERPGSKYVNTVLPFPSPVTCEFVLFEAIICPYMTTTIPHFIKEK